MAKKSMIARDRKRQRIAERFATRRAEIKAILQNPNADDESKAMAMAKLHAMPRDASPCRQRNRCKLTGRPHGVYSKFGLSRNMLREAAMRGDVPGLVKASW